jgi:hypothetical protein
MIEGGGGPCLLHKTGPVRGVVAHIGGQNLQRHISPQTRIACPVDFTHASGANQGHDLVGTELIARNQRPGGTQQFGRLGQELRGRRIQNFPTLILRQQDLDLALQVAIAAARASQKRGALIRVETSSRMVQLLDLPPAV